MPNATRSLILTAEVTVLPTAVEFFQAGGCEAGLPKARLVEMEIVVEEILTNVCEHAYPDGTPGTVELTWSVPAAGELRAEIADQGAAFNPLSLESPDLTLPLEDRPVGGLGFVLVRQFASSIDYRRENGWNRLIFGILAKPEQESNPRGEVTLLLAAWNQGDKTALDKMMPLVYAELHRAARRAWRRHTQGNTLEPTALIHEAYLKLAGAESSSFENRSHFLAVACKAMRQVLVNHAKKRTTTKRGGGAVKVSLDDFHPAVHQEAAEILALHKALDALQLIDPRKSSVVEARYFGGLSVEETAETLGISTPTVKRDWRLARSWLLREMNREGHAATA